MGVFVFAAPGGPDDGWLEIVIGNGASIGSYGGAEGYFPGTHHRVDAAFHLHTPDVHLAPEHETLVHSDPCTALVACRSDTLAVKGMVRWHARPPSAYLSKIFIALQPDDTSLQDYLLDAFTQTRPAWEQGCSVPQR